MSRHKNMTVTGERMPVGTLLWAGGIDGSHKENESPREAYLRLDSEKRHGDYPVEGICCFCGKDYKGLAHRDPVRKLPWYWCESCWKAKLQWEEECRQNRRDRTGWEGYRTLAAQFELSCGDDTWFGFRGSKA